MRKVLEAYRNTPGTCGNLRRPDRMLAVQLYQRGVPLSKIENALVLAAVRCLIRPAEAPLILTSHTQRTPQPRLRRGMTRKSKTQPRLRCGMMLYTSLPLPMLFLPWVTSREHKWVTLAEGKWARYRNRAIPLYGCREQNCKETRHRQFSGPQRSGYFLLLSHRFPADGVERFRVTLHR